MLYQGCTHPGRLVALATKVCVVSLNIFSILHPAFFLTYKRGCQFACTEKKALDNSEVHISLQNFESSVRNLFLFTLLAPKI